jgi:hypothetical protein
MRPSEFLLFLRHSFPTFIGGIFLALFSLVTAELLVLDAYFRDVALQACTMWLFGVLGGMTVVISICHFFLVYGRPQWVWSVVAVFLGCLLAVLPTIEHRPHKLLYILGVLFPLLGLLNLNSNRHREFRKVVVFVRCKRERFLGIRRARMRRLKAERRK